MTTTSLAKRGQAINGDLFTIRHQSLEMTAPFTSFVDVSFRGVTHQVLSAADRGAFSFANVTGEFTVGSHHGYVLETLDAVETQVAHRYQAVVSTPHGTLSVHSYRSVAELLALVGALGPTSSRLGVLLEPDDDVEFTSAPRVALSLDIGVVEITPLTAEVIDQLPPWQGTPVRGGQLYGGRFTDDAPYLTLVTETCRVLLFPGAGVDEDRAASAVADLEADWRA